MRNESFIVRASSEKIVIVRASSEKIVIVRAGSEKRRKLLYRQ